jgi:hypothetical protein
VAFSQEKVALYGSQKVYMYSENALGRLVRAGAVVVAFQTWCCDRVNS